MFYQKIIQYDLDGNKLAEYNSIKEATEKLGISRWAIIGSQKENRPTFGKWFFKYEGKKVFKGKEPSLIEKEKEERKKTDRERIRDVFILGTF